MKERMTEGTLCADKLQWDNGIQGTKVTESLQDPLITYDNSCKMLYIKYVGRLDQQTNTVYQKGPCS